MTSDTLYIKRPCGEGTNPKASGFNLTELGEIYYSSTRSKWYSGALLDPHDEMYPTYWLEPFTTIEHIQEEAFDTGAIANGSLYKFSDFRKDYLKRNGGE